MGDDRFQEIIAGLPERPLVLGMQGYKSNLQNH
jgi:hypothetical protein